MESMDMIMDTIQENGETGLLKPLEPDLNRHPGNISALFIRLASSKHPTEPTYGLMPKDTGCEGLTRANRICGGSRWRSNLRPRTGATSG